MTECPRDTLHSKSVAQCANMHTALPLQAEWTKLPLSGRSGRHCTWSTEEKTGDTGDAALTPSATLETPPSAHFFRTPRAPKDVCAT